MDAAVDQFPRLLRWHPEKPDTVQLLSWSASSRNQILFHNELLSAVRVTLCDLSARRAQFVNEVPRAEVSVPEVGAEALHPMEVTPPEGRR